ncbi:MAG: GGDEF-domain containing protein, partial [Mesorhizobium sp.]
MNERASSRVADAVDSEPHDPRQELGAAELRILYRTEAQAKRRKEARPGLWIAVVIYVLFSVSDLLLIPDVAALTITARFAVGLTALLVLEAQLRRGVATDWLDVTCAGAIIFGYLGWLYPASMGANKESVAYYMVFGTIFMMSANLFFTFRFKVSIITSTIILCILYVVNYFLPASLTYKMVFGTFYVSCFTFTS